MTEAQFLIKQAERCRWLAARIDAKDVARSLLQMADEYEERARQLERGGAPPEDG